MGLISRIKGMLQKMGADTRIAHEFRDIFEIGGVPAFNQFYNYGIFIWKYLYKGYYNAWHLVSAPTVNDPRGQRKLFRLNMPKAACAELAGLVWSEACKVSVNAKGFEATEAEPDDVLGRYIESVLDENAFAVKMQEAVEQMLALGGGVLKVWYEDKKDENGNSIPDSGKIRVGYCMADQFVPTAWDNAKVTEGVFISRIAKDGYYYTRLEWHKWNGSTYVVSNELYRADKTNGNKESQDILGYRIPLNTIYQMLAEETEMQGLEQSLFSYYRTPIANNVDDNSPLGISIYGNALETLHALDICYDSFVREFQLGKKRIIVPARCVRTVVDPDTGMQRRYFDATDETYEALATDDVNDLKITDNSVELRVEEHVSALNAFLSILCLQLGFSSSTFSFDTKSGLKTATEVVSENSKTWKTIATCQSMLKPAIEGLVKNIIAVATLYGVTFEGKSVESLAANGYDCNVYFDDSVIQDRQTDINEGVLLMTNGVMSKKRFMVEKLGMTPEQADAELAAIKDEGKIDVEAVDKFVTDAE